MLLVKRSPAYMLALFLAVAVVALFAYFAVSAHHIGGAGHSMGRHQVAGSFWEIIHPKG